MNRSYFIRTDAAQTFAPLDGEGEGMSGLFSKLHKAIAKPFTKIFKPGTLLGKAVDPFGLMSRNINLGGRIADVVGTAALVATGAYAVGAATGGTAGGFWATAGEGAKVVGGKLLAGGKALASGAGSLAKGTAAVLGPALLSGGRVGAAEQAPGPDAAAMLGPYGGSMDTLPTSGASGGDFGPGGPMMPGTPVTLGADGTPEATVEVSDTMPEDSGPNWLLIAGVGVAALALYHMSKSSRKVSA